MKTIAKLNTFIMLIFALCITAMVSNAQVTLYVGPDKPYQTITAALADVPATLDNNYEISVDIPLAGYVENGLDANIANFNLNGHTLILFGIPGGSPPSEVTYYIGDDIEYRQTSGSMVTIENISAGEQIARRTHSDGYFPNAPYELLIKNHLGSTMTLVDEYGQRVDAVYDYFPYGKQKIVASAPGAAKPVTQTFTGKELDLYADGDVTGADGEGRYYFGKRYYDADVGMWTSTDPADYYWNSYSYVGGNPISIIDPTGAVPDLAAIDGPDGDEYLYYNQLLSEEAPLYYEQFMGTEDVISLESLRETYFAVNNYNFLCRMLPNLDGGASVVDQGTGWMLAIAERLGVPKNALVYVGAMNISAKVIGQLCALKETDNLDMKELGVTGTAKLIKQIIQSQALGTLGSKDAKILGAVIGQGFETTASFIDGNTKRQPVR